MVNMVVNIIYGYGIWLMMVFIITWLVVDHNLPQPEKSDRVTVGMIIPFPTEPLKIPRFPISLY